MALVAPWYPSRQLPFRGAFVQAMVEATAPGCDRFTVFHCDEWPVSLSELEQDAIWRAHERLLPATPRRRPTVAGAELVHVPVPLRTGLGYAEIARYHERALRAALGGVPLAAPVVHAAVAIPGGWAALRNARPGARVYVTEHSTFLDQVLAQPQARAMLDEVLTGADGFFAVGERVRTPLVEAFPQHADRIGLVANPVDFDVARPDPVTALRRWLYVGGLIPRKGVTWLLEAFAVCRAEDPSLTLTLVGDGPLRAELDSRATELGVAGAVTFAGAVPPAQALRLMREHDLLVHPSRLETFGMTVVEAVASGMAVLVTRCGGPEETLAGIEEAAGELIPVTESAEPIVAGYRRLRDRFPHGLDLAAARQELAGRYGYPAVAAAHDGIWFPEPREPAPARSGALAAVGD